MIASSAAVRGTANFTMQCTIEMLVGTTCRATTDAPPGAVVVVKELQASLVWGLGVGEGQHWILATTVHAPRLYACLAVQSPRGGRVPPPGGQEPDVHSSFEILPSERDIDVVGDFEGPNTESS